MAEARRLRDLTEDPEPILGFSIHQNYLIAALVAMMDGEARISDQTFVLLDGGEVEVYRDDRTQETVVRLRRRERPVDDDGSEP